MHSMQFRAVQVCVKGKQAEQCLYQTLQLNGVGRVELERIQKSARFQQHKSDKEFNFNIYNGRNSWKTVTTNCGYYRLSLHVGWWLNSYLKVVSGRLLNDIFSV